MDPISVAGLALSAASLSFDIFAGCVKGFVLLSTAHNLGKDASYLQTMLDVEEYRFVQWAETVGLTSKDPNIPPSLNQALATNLIVQLQEKLESNNLKKRYKLELIPVPPTQQPILSSKESNNPDSQSILASAVSDSTRAEILARAGLMQSKNSFQRRLQWAAMDKAKFEELVHDIRDIVNALWSLLAPIRQVEMKEQLETTLSTMIKISQDLDALKGIQASLGKEAPGLSQAAELRAIKTQLPNETESPEGGPRSNQLPSILQAPSPKPLDRTLLKQTSEKRGTSGYYTAEYDSKPVLAEYKEVPPRMRAKLRLRAQNLATFLSSSSNPSFLTLKCLGFLEDKDNFIFLYEYPAVANADGQGAYVAQFRTLQYFLSSSKLSQPSVTARIKLALDICRTVQTIHTAGWLHKNIRSENILFFAPPQGDNTNPLDRPYLAGFSFAREDSATAISDQASADPILDIYRHPQALGEPSLSYESYMDLYSLGAVLLEVSEWRPLKHMAKKCVDVTKPHVDVPLAALAGIQEWLVKEHVDNGHAAFRMGDVYASGLPLLLKPRKRTDNLPQQEDKDDLLSFRSYLARLSRCIV
jgi:hypothetical protein